MGDRDLAPDDGQLILYGTQNGPPHTARSTRPPSAVRAPLAGVSLALVAVDRDGILRSWNRAAEQLFGWPAAEVLGQSLRVISPEPLNPLRGFLEAGLDSGPPEGVELTHRRKNGSRVQILGWRAPWLGEAGEQAGSIGFFAEAPAGQQTLAERSRQLEAVRAVAAEIAQHLDLTALLELIVQRAVDLVGAGRGMIRLWDPESQLLVPHAWTGSRTERAVVPLRLGEAVAGTAALRRTGLIVNDFPTSPYVLPVITQVSSHTAVLAEPLLYRDRLVGVISIVRDAGAGGFVEEDRKLVALFATHAAIAIENARLHQAAVRRGEEREALLRATRSVMSGLELDAILDRILAEAAAIAGTEHVRVLLVDRGAAVLRVVRAKGNLVPQGYEYPVDKGLSAVVVAERQPLFCPDVGADPRSYFGRRYRALGMLTYLGLPVKRGEEVVGVLVFSTTTPRTYGPDELAYLTAFADQAAIAIEHARLYAAVRQTSEELERRVEARTQELRRATEELGRQERLAMLGQLAGGVGHELRHPLGVIGNAAYYLRMRLRELADDKVQKHLAILDSEVRRANRIITDLLDFSQVTPPTRTAVDLNAILQELLHHVPEDAKVQRACTLDPALPLVSVDADQIRQVLLNVLSNAVEAMPNGGWLRITTCARGETVTVTVADTGIGIPPENLESIFRPLFTTKARGIGLGLAVCRQLAEANSGTLTVESRVGAGSTFLLTFPQHRGSERGGAER